ncbi:MAG: FAD-dependent oxidoreductase [Actinomycetes bacterium]
MRDPRYDILFEPVPIGPVTAPNRFFQVPHCNGMGYRDVTALATMRGIKAEGGWGVVCTEQVEFHYSSDITPFIELRLWDDQDIPALARMADRVHEHGALAGLELSYNGMNGPNLYSREAPMGPAHLPVATWSMDPVQARAMTKDDIVDLRRWHKAAAGRAIKAGYDIVYVYAGHALGGIHHFLSPRYNQRTDEYGGSTINRMRLLREILEETREACEGQAAVACRITVDELLGADGIDRTQIEEIVGELAEHPDLWDFVLGSWEDDSVTSRFGPEAGQEEYVRGLKKLTTRPVVGVGRFTSPDTMVRQVNQGILDLIGAARPSIADPFLPRKIEEGRLEDIRECIGCNICVSGDFTMSPIRCTQNPTMGEEWRRGWHPERIKVRGSETSVLVVGAGPSGLEAARALGQRGYDVTLTEATRQLGGRAWSESKLPGLAAWVRVLDYREQQIRSLKNVEVALESQMEVDDIIGSGFEHVVVATGARWRHDGIGRWHLTPVPSLGSMPVLTPDDVMSGVRPKGKRVVVFDDDHYYMGGVLSELLAGEGYNVQLVTPAAQVSSWTNNTLEILRVQERVLNSGVHVRTAQTLISMEDGEVTVACAYTGRESAAPADAVVMVTARLPRDELSTDLNARQAEWDSAGLLSVRAIGDAFAPATIAAAVYEGHKYAQELDGPPRTGDTVPFRREVTGLAPEETVV